MAPGRGRDLERFLTFVDAVVAIAITLLVLPLVELTSDVSGSDSVADLLRDHETQIGAFLLSFVVIASLWSSQHHVMSPVVAQHPVVSRLLMLWTLTIVVLPFPTALVAVAGHEAVTKLLYLGTMALSSLCLALIAEVVARRPGLRDSEEPPDATAAWVTVFGFLLALGLSLAVPSLSYYPLLLLLLTGPVTRLWRRVGRGRVPVGE